MCIGMRVCLMIVCYRDICFFFFKQKTAYEMRISDWSSDVCSSDLVGTMVQEAYATSDAICAACEASITAYCEALAPDIDAAIARHGIAHGVDRKSVV